MNYIRILFLTVRVYISHTKALGKLKIYLNCDQRILLAVNVLYLYIQFRCV